MSKQEKWQDINNPVTLSFGLKLSPEQRIKIQSKGLRINEQSEKVYLDYNKAAYIFNKISKSLYTLEDSGDKGTWRRWDGVKWDYYHQNHIITDIKKCFPDYIVNDRQTIEICKALSHIGNERFIRKFDGYDIYDTDDTPKSCNGIQHKTGVTILDNNDNLVKLNRPHQPSDYNTATLNANWDPKATCPNWEKILNKVMPDTSGQLLLQQMFGYCIANSIHHQVIFAIIGEPGSGKSTVLNVLATLLGNYCTTIDLSLLGDRFETYRLLHKKVAICSEEEFIDQKSECRLKQISGDDPIRIEEKYKSGTTVKLRTKVILTSNGPPKFSDKSSAIWDRLIMIPFEQQINLSNANTMDNTLSSLKQEYDGILKWAYKGILSLTKSTGIRSQKFQQYKQGNLLKQEHREISDPLLNWAEHHIIADEKSYVAKQNIYNHYQEWYKNNGLKEQYQLGQPNFFTRLQHFLKTKKIIISEERRRINGDRPRCIIGIRLEEIETITPNN